MAKLNGRMLAKFIGCEQLYDDAVKNEEQGNEIREQYRQDFNDKYNRLKNI